MTNLRGSREAVWNLADRLGSLDPGKWTAEDLRRMALVQGWEWTGAPERSRLRTGTPFGDAWTTPVDEYLRDFATTEDCLGLHFALGTVGGGVREHVEAFRRAALDLRIALGEPHVMGAEDPSYSFHRDTPRWGAPFMRWRSWETTLELRATVDGPALTLRPTGPAEAWLVRSMDHSPGSVSGFLAHALDSEVVGGFYSQRPVPEIVGMTFPGLWRPDDWTEYGRSLADALRTMPAELTALGVERRFGLHGLIPGTDGPWVFRLDIGQTVELGLDAALESPGIGLSEVDPPSLGWTRSTESRHLDDEVVYHSPSYSYDGVNGVRLAMMVIDTAEALGIRSPRDLSLTDSGDQIRIDRVDGDGIREYYVHDYGLAVKGNP